MQGTSLHAQWVAGNLPARPASAHKGTFGTLHIMAGSMQYRGAAMLAAAAALRTGAGIVRLCALEEVCAATAAFCPSAVLKPLAHGYSGGIAAGSSCAVLANKPTAILAGCGMGATAQTHNNIAGLLQGAPCPLVLDADALNVLSGRLIAGYKPVLRNIMLSLLASRTAPTIITPHVGEMARLANLPVQKVSESMGQVALDFANTYGCVVVLKSAITVIAAPDGTLLQNDKAGNNGLATGGSGDLLAGIIGALLAQGLGALQAAGCGVWLHATAADTAASAYGSAGLLPQDIPPAIAQVLKTFYD